MHGRTILDSEEKQGMLFNVFSKAEEVQNSLLQSETHKMLILLRIEGKQDYSEVEAQIDFLVNLAGNCLLTTVDRSINDP